MYSESYTKGYTSQVEILEDSWYWWILGCTVLYLASAQLLKQTAACVLITSGPCSCFHCLSGHKETDDKQLKEPWQSFPTTVVPDSGVLQMQSKKIPYQQANLSPDIEVLKHADTEMVLHSEIGLLGLPGRSRSLPLPCPTRCSCCCHRSTSLPGARRGMLRWVRWCWDSWFSLRWKVPAFEQQVNIEWTGFVRIFLWNCNISPTWKLWIVGFPERDCLAKFFGGGCCR